MDTGPVEEAEPLLGVLIVALQVRADAQVVVAGVRWLKVDDLAFWESRVNCDYCEILYVTEVI